MFRIAFFLFSFFYSIAIIHGQRVPTRVTFVDVEEVDLHIALREFKIGAYNPPNIVIQAANRYAISMGFGAGVPTFEIGHKRVRGVYLIHGLPWVDIPQKSLEEFGLIQNTPNSPIAWYRAVNRFANDKHGGRQSIPTYEIGANWIRGAYLFPHFKSFDVTEAELHQANPEFKVGQENSFEVWFRASNRWANNRGYVMGIPNFEIGPNRVRGVTCIVSGKKESGNFFDKLGRELYRTPNNLSKIVQQKGRIIVKTIPTALNLMARNTNTINKYKDDRNTPHSVTVIRHSNGSITTISTDSDGSIVETDGEIMSSEGTGYSHGQVVEPYYHPDDGDVIIHSERPPYNQA